MKIGFVSLGCAKNLVDSEEITGLLKENGHVFVSNPRDADAILINTCGFIDPAKQESINTILEMTKKADTVIALGCLAERYEDDLKNLIPELKAVIPIRDYPRLPELLSEALETPIHNCHKRLVSTGESSAYVKISEGCSNFCSFCAIPLIRGKQQSKLIHEVRQEVQDLISRGISEITLIAQDTTKYGVDRYGKPMLADLIRELDSIEGLHWIRILYMYPDEITPEILDAMLHSRKVLPYFDIPIQHVNDRLLRKMNRRGTKDEVKALVSNIRTLFPEAVLRTTIIVGFPSETEEDFQELLDFVAETKWDRLGAFVYSKEEDTSAYHFQPEVDIETAQDRLDRLMTLQQQISLENNQKKVGKVIEVLVEDQDGISGLYRGRSAADAPDEADGKVIFQSEVPLKSGEYVNVRVTEARQYDLIGFYEGRPE